MAARTRPAALATLAALAALVLAGCGGGDTTSAPSAPSGDLSALSPQEIQDAAEAATAGAASLHVAGSLTSGGRQEVLDLRLDDHGDCAGTLQVGTSGRAEILGAGGHYWYRPDPAFWRAYAGSRAEQIIGAVGRDYVANPDLATLCDLDSFFGRPGAGTATPTDQGTDTVDGQPVVKVATTDRSGTTVGYVRTAEPHYVVRIERTGPDAGSFIFDDFGAPLDVAAPAADQVADLSKLGR